MSDKQAKLADLIQAASDEHEWLDRLVQRHIRKIPGRWREFVELRNYRQDALERFKLLMDLEQLLDEKQ